MAISKKNNHSYKSMIKCNVTEHLIGPGGGETVISLSFRASSCSFPTINIRSAQIGLLAQESVNIVHLRVLCSAY